MRFDALLLELFDVDSLHRWLSRAEPTLVGEIAWSRPAAQIAFDIESTCRRFGVLTGPALWQSLLTERPQRIDAIREAADALNVVLPDPPPPPPPAPDEPVPRPAPKAPVASARALLLLSNPPDAGMLNLLGAIKRIRDQLKLGDVPPSAWTLTELPAANLGALLNAVRSQPPSVDVVHFMGHGSPQGVYFTNEAGTDSELVAPEQLRDLLADRGVQLVLLDSCASDDLASVLLQAVDTVVTTTDRVDTEVAGRFGAHLYVGLAKGLSVAAAVRDARAVAGSAAPYTVHGNGDLVLFGSAPPVAEPAATEVPELSGAVRLLHLSGSLFPPDPSAATRRAKLVEDVEKLGGVDLVLVTGNAGGASRAYGALRSWLVDDLLPPLGLDEGRVVVVPGDLDVATSATLEGAIRAAYRGWRMAPELDDVNEHLRAGTPPRLDAFRALAARFGARCDTPWFGHAVEVRGQRIHLAGLCTPWLTAAGESDQGRLLVGSWQISQALPHDVAADHVVALMHHPPSWLAAVDRRQCIEQLVANRADVLLHGHVNGPEVNGSSQRRLALTLGTSLAADPPGYAHVTLESASITVSLRRWSAVRDQWIADADHGETLQLPKARGSRQ